MAGENTQALGAFAKPVELIKNADAAPGKGGERRARHSELRKWPKAKDQARVQNQIEDVRDPEQAHGDRGIARSSEDRIVQKEHHDNAGAAKRNPRVVDA